jgi:GH15 family glucan-1,4-alpha-glucosidase
MNSETLGFAMPSRYPGMTGAMTEIGDLALLSDCATAALVGSDGSVDWWPGPRFDGPSALGRLLDPAAGHFSVRPVAAAPVQRSYVPGTLVLVTEHRTPNATLRVTDCLALAPGARGHEIGLRSPDALVRLVEALGGEAEVAIELAPRPEYGLTVPRLVREGGAIATIGGSQRLFLTGGEDLELDGATATGAFRLRDGERRGLVLRRTGGIDAAPPEPIDAAAAIEETIAAWRSWSELHDSYDGPYRAEVLRSALVVQGLTYQRSGAVVAAPSTSLPEVVGGAENWDYRFAWLRDSSLVARALDAAMCSDESVSYFDWMTRAAATCRHDEHVQIVFGLEGERALHEHELDHLRGHRDSRPVRVGNAAWRQKQLDVLGEVLEVAWRLGENLELDDFQAGFLCDLVQRAAEHWREPDAGIWEARGSACHHTTSKVMCWVALDRGVRLADRLGPQARPERWAAARDEVGRHVLEHAWSDALGGFAGILGGDGADVATLLMTKMGFLDAGDERMRATYDAIERELGVDGLLRRHSEAGDEGAFLPASFWLAGCRAMAGEPDRARATFERALTCANDVGLLSEMSDPASGAALGNTPQALTHVALIVAADAIGVAEREASGARVAQAR